MDLSDNLWRTTRESLDSILLSNEKVTVITGAGISIDSPSNVSSANSIKRTILDYIQLEQHQLPETDFNAFSFELLIQHFSEIFDPNLDVFDYFSQFDQPNLNHYFIACLLHSAHSVITTNFDCLIEHAYRNLLNIAGRQTFRQEPLQLKPLITKQDYIDALNMNAMEQNRLVPLVKIHGSKKNVISGEDTSNSIVATFRALSKNREQLFTLESYKKNILLPLIREKIIIVLGYSGNDFLDVMPVLSEFPKCKKIIWVQHHKEILQNMLEIKSQSDFKYQLYKIDPKYQGEVISKSFSSTLFEMATKSKIDIYLVRTNTTTFVEKYLWHRLIPHININIIKSNLASIQPSKSPDFGEWIKSRLITPSIFDKYLMLFHLYLSVKNFKPITPILQDALIQAEEANLPEYCALYHNYLGYIAQFDHDYDRALTHFEKAIQFDKAFNNPERVALDYIRLGDLQLLSGNDVKARESCTEAFNFGKQIQPRNESISGMVYNLLANLQVNANVLDKARNNFWSAYKIVEEQGDLSGRASILINIANISVDEDALKYYNQAIEISQAIGDLSIESIGLYKIGEIFYHKNKSTQAKPCFEKSLELSKIRSDQSLMGSNYWMLGRILSNEISSQSPGQSRAAIDLAEDYFDGAIKAFSKINFEYELFCSLLDLANHLNLHTEIEDFIDVSNLLTWANDLAEKNDNLYAKIVCNIRLYFFYKYSEENPEQSNRLQESADKFVKDYENRAFKEYLQEHQVKFGTITQDRSVFLDNIYFFQSLWKFYVSYAYEADNIKNPDRVHEELKKAERIPEKYWEDAMIADFKKMLILTRPISASYSPSKAIPNVFISKSNDEQPPTIDENQIYLQLMKNMRAKDKAEQEQKKPFESLNKVDKQVLHDLEKLISKPLPLLETEVESKSDSLLTGADEYGIKISNQHIIKITLAHQFLNQLPPNLDQLKNLEELDLSYNNFKEIPAVIYKMKYLRDLNLNDNQIMKVSKNIQDLKDLKNLSLSNNKILSLPEEFSRLKGLKKLELGGNRLGSLPASFGNLSSLNYLDLCDNNLIELPPSLGSLSRLSRLYLQKNSLKILPLSMKNLVKLEIMNIMDNPICEMTTLDTNQIRLIQDLLKNKCEIYASHEFERRFNPQE
jgi:tetratricopeptide (TPR) repeat protein